ncbi:predicted protein [Naegleria gruberi]|uniref:Predicted protein n=1 Tax=Naegleria gruberi TaxID=5762 RepID=D2W190_NAEGR|nr:uncharacterized protein NAEGRDRAFT_75133 [Naegleria gruberi]EFC37143.1 predicted protein [Naegleria gruberi]|eukprot:XP_002669887.1 predicted protein [Naegleria gruberi strain NEG-M]
MLNTETKLTFHHAIFELSEGYFFIDQILPFFSFNDLENLFLTSKHIAELVSRQHHIDYLAVFNAGLAHYSSSGNRNRWIDSTPPNEFPSLLQFANGIKVMIEAEGSWLIEYIIGYCRKVNKLFSISYDKYIYNWSQMDLSLIKNIEEFGLVRLDMYNFPKFMPLFEGKKVKQIKLSMGYIYQDIFEQTRPVLDKINFKELYYSISWVSSFNILSEGLSKEDLDFRNKIKISVGDVGIDQHHYSSLKNISKCFEFSSITIENATKKEEDYSDHKFDLFSKSYTLKAAFLTKVQSLALPKFSNTEPSAIEMHNIELALNSANIDTFHVLHTTKYLTELKLQDCHIDFSDIDAIDLKLLNNMVLNRCKFVKNGKQSNLEFIECISAPKLTNLTCGDLSLKSIPMISKSITTLKLGKNEIENIELERLDSMKGLTSLDLSNNKLNDLKNVQSIIGKFKDLKLNGNPIFKRMMINKNKLEFINDDCKHDVKRSTTVKHHCQKMEIPHLLELILQAFVKLPSI